MNFISSQRIKRDELERIKLSDYLLSLSPESSDYYELRAGLLAFHFTEAFPPRLVGAVAKRVSVNLMWITVAGTALDSLYLN